MNKVIGNTPLSPNEKAKNIDVAVVSQSAQHTEKERKLNIFFIVIGMKITVGVLHKVRKSFPEAVHSRNRRKSKESRADSDSLPEKEVKEKHWFATKKPE